MALARESSASSLGTLHRRPGWALMLTNMDLSVFEPILFVALRPRRYSRPARDLAQACCRTRLAARLLACRPLSEGPLSQRAMRQWSVVTVSPHAGTFEPSPEESLPGL